MLITHILGLLVVGLTIVAMGTSAPEAAVSITAALKGNASIAIGNVVGSNILIILGVTAVITSVAIQKSTLFVEIPYMLVVTIVLIIMGANDGSVTRMDGIIAVAAGVLLWISVCKKLELRRPWGIVMLISYAAYFVYLLV